MSLAEYHFEEVLCIVEARDEMSALPSGLANGM